MGRGDRKTEKGKRTKASFGNSRPHKQKAKPAPAAVADKPAKKPAAKKAAAKKAE